MAVDPGALDLMRGDLAGIDGISEKSMFGGLGFMMAGHMLGGIMSGGALLYRVGKARQNSATGHDGVSVMQHGGRIMSGFVMVEGEAQADDDLRAGLLRMALDNHADLPPKE